MLNAESIQDVQLAEISRTIIFFQEFLQQEGLAPLQVDQVLAFFDHRFNLQLLLELFQADEIKSLWNAGILTLDRFTTDATQCLLERSVAGDYLLRVLPDCSGLYLTIITVHDIDSDLSNASVPFPEGIGKQLIEQPRAGLYKRKLSMLRNFSIEKQIIDEKKVSSLIMRKKWLRQALIVRKGEQTSSCVLNNLPTLSEKGAPALPVPIGQDSVTAVQAVKVQLDKCLQIIKTFNEFLESEQLRTLTQYDWHTIFSITPVCISASVDPSTEITPCKFEIKAPFCYLKRFLKNNNVQFLWNNGFLSLLPKDAVFAALKLSDIGTFILRASDTKPLLYASVVINHSVKTHPKLNQTCEEIQTKNKLTRDFDIVEKDLEDLVDMLNRKKWLLKMMQFDSATGTFAETDKKEEIDKYLKVRDAKPKVVILPAVEEQDSGVQKNESEVVLLELLSSTDSVYESESEVAPTPTVSDEPAAESAELNQP